MSNTTLPNARASSKSLSFAPHEWCLLVGFTAALALLAIWPHVAISISTGQITFFKNAFDEDTYSLLADLGHHRLDRTLSFAVFEALQILSGGSKTFAFIAMDAILIPGAFLAAYYIACALFQSVLSRLMFALLLIFSPDLFSLGNATIFAGPLPTLETWRSMFGEMGAVLVPPSETSFLMLTRTPEPQTVYVVGFFTIGLLLRFVTDVRDSISYPHLFLLAVSQILLILSYNLLSYPIFAVQIYAAAVLFFLGSYRRALYLGGLTLAACIYAVLGARAVVSNDIGFFFASRLPMLPPSIFASAILVLVLSVWTISKRSFRDSRLLLAFAFAGLPIALLNQQVLTGVMFSTRDWERVSTLPLLVIAIGLSWPYIFASTAERLAAGLRYSLSILALCLICTTVGIASVRSYHMWRHDNIASIAAAQLITRSATPTSKHQFVLDQPGIAPLIRVRLYPADAHFVVDYTRAFLSPIKRGLENGFSPGPLSLQLFEYWRWTDMTPDMATDILQKEAQEKGGYYSGFLFNICEYWYPCTDSRAVKSDAVKAAIPRVIVAYKTYLNSHKSPSAIPTYLLSSKRDAYSGFNPHALATIEISGITMRIFEERK